jgi:hypothetical protein
MGDDQRKAREERLKVAWRWEIAAKEAGLWVDLVPMKCPECSDGGEWPAAFGRPTCGRCYYYHGERVQMHRVREPAPPPPPKRTTRDEIADLKSEIARLADALEERPEEEPPDVR